MPQYDPILLMNKHAGVRLGVGETGMTALARDRALPFVRIERGSTTLFPAQYVTGLQYFMQVHECTRITKELVQCFGHTPFAMQLQGYLRHLFWEMFRDVDGLDISLVEMLFGLTTTPGARTIQRWGKKGVFTLQNGKIPASQLSAACVWWDMDYR